MPYLRSPHTHNIDVSIMSLRRFWGSEAGSPRNAFIEPVVNGFHLDELRIQVVAAGLDAGAIHVVYGFGGERVVEAFPGRDVSWVLQAEQLGTGHAVAQAIPHISDDDIVLVLCGDVPLIRAESLQPLVEAARAGAAVLTVVVDDPQGPDLELINWAEIAAARDIDRNFTVDDDSYPDADNTNDLFAIDNYIDG